MDIQSKRISFSGDWTYDVLSLTINDKNGSTGVNPGNVIDVANLINSLGAGAQASVALDNPSTVIIWSTVPGGAINIAYTIQDNFNGYRPPGISVVADNNQDNHVASLTLAKYLPDAFNPTTYTIQAGELTGDGENILKILNRKWFQVLGDGTKVLIEGETGSSLNVSASQFSEYYHEIAYIDGELNFIKVSCSITVGDPQDNGVATVSSILTNTPGIYQEGMYIIAPRISGDPDGESANPKYAYQWFAGNMIISGATSESYLVPDMGTDSYAVAITYTDFEGHTATVKSTAQTVAKMDNGQGSTATIASQGSAAFNEGVSLLAGAINGDPDGAATITAYQWLLNGSAITGATGASYTTSATGFGAYTVEETYTDAQGFIATVTSGSQNVAMVDNGQGTAAAITAQGAAVFNEGVTLLAGAINGDPDGAATITAYQWLLNGSAITGATGASYTTSATGFGAYTVEETYTDAQGFIATVTSGSQNVAMDPNGQGIDASITDIGDNLGTIQGTIAHRGITNDTTPTLSGTIASALSTGSTLRVYCNDLYLGNATVVGNIWFYTPTTALTSGTYGFKVAIFSSAGVAGSFSNPRSIVLDNTAPLQTLTIASVSDNTDPVQGVVAAGGRTNDTTPTLTGTLSVALGEGDSIKLYNGTTFLVDAVVDNTTLTWSATPTLTTDASYTITARVVDAAGNQGPASAKRILILDTKAPLQTVTITAISDNLGTTTGLLADGGITNDTTPTLTGTLSAALATGEVVRVSSNGVLSGNAVVKGTTWSYTPATALNINGTYAFTAQVIDGAGNRGPLSAPRSIVLDTIAPAKTVAINSVSDNTDPVPGIVAAGGRTNDTTPTLTGTLSEALAVGESLKLFNGTTFLVDAVVSGTAWSATPTLTGNGSFTITARVVDSAGNQGPASPSRVLILDTTVPTQVVAISNVSDNAGTIQGSVADGASTNDTTPTLSGTFGAATAGAALATSETLRIFINGAIAGNATVSVVAAGQSTWGFTPATPLPINGSYAFTTQVVDGAGNGGPLSTPRSIVLDAPISTAAQDTLTGIAASADLYLLPQLSYSALGSAGAPTYDTITNFEAIDKLHLSGRAYKANITSSSGTAAGLDPTQLAPFLPANWAANTARAFKVTGFNGTFVALNNNVAGFQNDQDAILFLNAYNPSATTPIGIL